MSIGQLIPTLGKELDELRARLARLEGMLGDGTSHPSGSNAQRFCDWAYCNGACKRRDLTKPPSPPCSYGVPPCTSYIVGNKPPFPASTHHGLRGRTPTYAPTRSAAYPTRIFRQSKSLPRSYQAPTLATKPYGIGIPASSSKSRESEARRTSVLGKAPTRVEAKCRIYVGGITEDLTKDDIREYFGRYGLVVEVFIPVPFRHICFVEFDVWEVAQSLIGKELKIKGVNVKISRAFPSVSLPRSPGRRHSTSPQGGRQALDSAENALPRHSRLKSPGPASPRDFNPRSRSSRRSSYNYDGNSRERDLKRRSSTPPPTSNPKPQVQSPSLSSAQLASSKGQVHPPSTLAVSQRAPFASATGSYPPCTPTDVKMPVKAPMSTSAEKKKADVSSRNITVWFGTGHAKYSPTTCKIDIVVNGLPAIQSNVLGRLHSITCMKEYENKSMEELHWEDHRAGRKGQAGKSLKKDGESRICSMKRESLVEEDGDEKCDKMAEKELPCADSAAGRKVLPPASPLKGSDSGTPLEEKGSDHVVPLRIMVSSKVREEDTVIEENTVGEESGGSSPVVTQIISMRPKLKGKVKK